MGKVAIVTDSTANLPAGLAEEYEIHVIPVKSIFCEQSFRDGIDITPAQFYEMLAKASELPTTSQPSVGEFVEVYTCLSKEAEGIVSIHLSDLLSGTIQSALAANELVSDVSIEIIDSRSTSLGLGFVVLAASRAAQAGKTFHEVIEIARAVIPKINVLFVVDTLKYLHMGGRIGGATALLGTMLRIKALLHLSEGQVQPLERVRSKRRATERMLDIMGERLEVERSDSVLHVAVIHAASPDEAEELKEKVLSRFHPDELYLTELTPALGTHVGPGTLGVGWYVD